MRLNPLRHHASEGFRYLVVGGLTTLINLGVYQMGLWFEMEYLVATTIAFVLSVVFAFFANKYFVFKVVTQNATSQELVMFAGSRLSTFSMETVGLLILISGLAVQEMIAKLVMNIIVILLNYMISKFWIFKGGKREEDGEV
ncbi:GtrA family protein [Fusibacter sp. 3D3]|uniref:GtrA family protein n=1 Tax=Fusibacter sp. 3D3 TaxID=1048380 RepID=UPI000853AAC9|nr:GtrA family protein [Fusibacter sp. 3D3]